MTPLLIAHRTAPLHAPENTLAGIRAAVDAGAQVVEIDVRRGLGRTLFLHHDSHGWRLLRFPWVLRWTPWGLLKHLPQRGQAGRLATFEQALELLGELSNHVSYAVDTKQPSVAPLVVEAVRSAGLGSRIRPWSERPKAVRIYVAGLPHSEVALLRSGDTPADSEGFLDRAAELGASAVSAHWLEITHEFVEAAHGRNLKVYPWNQDWLDDLEAKLGAGIDGVVTDHLEVVGAAIVDNQSDLSGT
ncbi:MAG: glycerophosphodiester phosphodiesterase [Acidimicrobiales bacterium]